MMDEHGPDEQFEATNYDEDENIKLPPSPLAEAKPKRLTVADLAKRFDELEKDIDATVFESLSALDTRLDDLKDFIGDTTVREISQLKAQTDTLKATVEDDVLRWLGELAVRLETLETTTATHNKTLLGDVKTRLDRLDKAVGALADALTDHIQEAATPQPEPKTELEFAQPPQQTAGEHTRAGDIDVVASACETMNDVLMITRVLKADREILDEDRTYIITIACRAAGVPLSPGLQIRAGVRNVEA